MDRFHAILHSGEIRLADATTMVIIIFVVRRTPGTFATFARTLQSAKGPLIRWDEPDLRNTEGKDEQIASIRKWGRLTTLKNLRMPIQKRDSSLGLSPKGTRVTSACA